MAAKDFMRIVSGVLTRVAGVQTSAGAGNAGDIPALDDSGRLHSSMMPVGIGADVKVLAASENLTAGDFINIWNDGGTFKARKSDGTNTGKPAHGFVKESVTSGNDATVYFEGENDQLSGLDAGSVYLSVSVAGGVTQTAPTTAGQILQKLGVAVSATSMNVEIEPQINL